MTAKKLICFLLFSQTFAGGFNWINSRDELAKEKGNTPARQVDEIETKERKARNVAGDQPPASWPQSSPFSGPPSYPTLVSSTVAPSRQPSSSPWSSPPKSGGSIHSKSKHSSQSSPDPKPYSPSKPHYSKIPVSSMTKSAVSAPPSMQPLKTNKSSPSKQASTPTKSPSTAISSPSQGKPSQSSGSYGASSSVSVPGSGSSKPSGSSPQGSSPSGSSAGKPGSPSSYSAGQSSAASSAGKQTSPAQAPGGPKGSGSVCKTTCATQCPGSGPTATLGCGTVVGTTTSLPQATASVNKFLGIPFAQSPPQRFSPPQKPGSCNIEAKAWKPACIQQFVYPKAVQDFTKAVFNSPGGTPPEESEDCLYLNVYAPSSPAPYDGRAVMFWIYGGALQFGTASQPGYDGSYFAAYEDVIVVTINYRTNVFGFATSPEIPVTKRNLGFLDQRAALEWVQRNIASFGGSPDKVTIFGESAGGFSVDALLTSYPKDSKPPFRGAIMESGQISYNAQPRPSTVPQWNHLAGLLGCPGNYGSNLSCLRAANATVIKNAIEMNIIEFNPAADNVTLVHNPAQMRLSGNIAHIPVLEGSNAQEGRVFSVGQNNLTTFLQTLLPSSTPNRDLAISALTAAYAPFGTGYDAISQLFTEYVFQCPAALHAKATASIGIPAWRYYFNATFSNLQPFNNAFKLGVYHSSEIGLVFSTYPRTNVTTQEYALSNTMRRIWVDFAKNPAGGPGWNQVGSGIEGNVLDGATVTAEGGLYLSGNGTMLEGSWDLAVLGNNGDSLGSGVTIIDEKDVDSRCGIFTQTYLGFESAG